LLTRRSLLAACACCLSPRLPVLAQTSPDEGLTDVFCSTPQLSAFEGLALDQDRANPFAQIEGIIKLKFPFDGQAITSKPFQLFLPGDAWVTEDSLPGPNGKIRIGVFFIDGSKWQRDSVREYASRWTSKEGLPIIEWVWDNQEQNHIRILFDTTKNESAVGRQATKITDKTKPTMWLGDVRESYSQARVRWAILHEFGHALGMRHEHQHPDNGIKWNKQVVYNALKSYGWTEKDVQTNIFTVYSGKAYLCDGAEKFDPTSIMLYPVPDKWAHNFKASPASTLSKSDLICVQRRYGLA
jgi:hypothetical protein